MCWIMCLVLRDNRYSYDGRRYSSYFWCEVLGCSIFGVVLRLMFFSLCSLSFVFSVLPSFDVLRVDRSSLLLRGYFLGS